MPDDKRFTEIDSRIARLESLLLNRIPPVFDPPPDDWGRWGGFGGFGGWRPVPIPWPNPGDPVPIDISRLTRAQLQVSLESIKAQRIRLDAMENMINQQLKSMR